MPSIALVQFVCLCVLTSLVTCDSDVTKETLSSLQQQVQTLQAACQRQNDEHQEFKERIEDLEAENKLLKDYLQSDGSQQRRVSEEGAGIGFSASLSTPKALGEHQIIVFDTVVTNDGDSYDPHQGHFTAPVTGLYAFSVTVMCDGSESNLHAAIMRDGQMIGKAYANGSSYDNGSKLVVVQLEAGQMVWVEHFSDPSGYKIHGYGHSAFSGFLIMAY
ncbi:complement C1q-like protein 4 isoform X2 [Argopecten irradians]|uniref:complement C1q-like protein 4 isoform X2 n=1 Tax=Argopecten irradians TaxID=31199 RepID=UPI003721BDE9